MSGAKFFAFGATSGGGSGDVVGPASATDNGIAVYDDTTGKLLKSTPVTIDGDGNIIGFNAFTAGDLATLNGGFKLPSDELGSFGDNSEVEMQFSTADADAYSMRVGLPNDLSGNNTGAIWFGAQSDVIGTDIGIETGDSYVLGIFEKNRVSAVGIAPIDAVATIVGVGTKAFQMFNPASGVVFSIASDDTDTLITPEEETELAVSGILNATDGGVRGKISTANVTNPPTDAELDSAFGTPSTVGAGFTALLDDNGAGTAVYLVGSDGTNWWHLLMTKAV